MSTLEPWIAGFFDSSGFVYRTVQDKLAVRIMLPGPDQADQIAARLGGRVRRAQTKPQGATYTLSKPQDIDEFLRVVGPSIRGQWPAKEILEFWRSNELDVEQAQLMLETYYKRYMPNIRPLRTRTQTSILEPPQEGES